MSRGLRWFVMFCGVVVAVVLAFALYLGPNVLAFLFHGERSTEPFVMVSFVDFSGDAARERYRVEYAKPARQIFADAGGRLIWQGTVSRVMEGRPDDRWDALVLVGYPSRESFINMVTSGAYREIAGARSQSVSRSSVIAATPLPDADFASADHGGCALLLHRFVDEQARAVYHETYLTAQLESAMEAGATVIWRASASPLRADPNFAWTDLVLLSFGSEYQLSQWAHHPVWRSRQALARPLMERWALVQLAPDRPMP